MFKVLIYRFIRMSLLSVLSVLSVLSALLSMLLIPSMASADVSHYADMLVGEQAVGLGGAFAAVANDPSGIYYNPGGLAFAIEERTSVSGNAYSKKEIRTLSGFDSNDFIQRSSGVIPAFFGNLKFFGDENDRTVGGFGIAIPTNILVDQEDRVGEAPTFKLRSLYHKIKQEVSETHFLFAAARKISADTGIGLTVGLVQVKYVSQQFLKAFVGPRDNSKDPSKPIYTQFSNNYSINGESNSAEFLLGLRHELSGEWSIGVTGGFFSTIRESLNWSAESASVFTNADSIPYQEGDLPADELGEAREPPHKIHNISEEYHSKVFLKYLPPRARLGIAFHPSGEFLWTLDSTYFAHIPNSELNSGHAVVNFASGLEMSIPWNSLLRFGLFSNRDASPLPSAKGDDNQSSMDFYGTSFCVAHAVDKSLISLTGVFQEGRGKARSINIDGVHPVREMRGFSYLVQVALSGRL